MIFDGGAEGPESVLVGSVDPAGTLPALYHKPGLLEHAQVLADRRPRHLELRRDLSCGQLPVPYQFQDAQPTGRRDHLQWFHTALTLASSARRRVLPGSRLDSGALFKIELK